MAPSSTAPKPPAGKAGSGLNKKIGPVPVKYLLAAAIVVVGYLLWRHYKASASTSAGSNSTPTGLDDTTGVTPSSDGAGGGASGDQGTTAASTPTYSPLPGTFNYYFSSATPNQGGGNTSDPQVPNNDTQPQTSFGPNIPSLVPEAQMTSSVFAGADFAPFNPGNYQAPTDITSTLAAPSKTVQIGGGSTATTSAAKKSTVSANTDVVARGIAATAKRSGKLQ